MTELDPQAFIAELKRMGIKLTALQLAHGTFKVYRWRMLCARERVSQIEALWNSQVADNWARSIFSRSTLFASEDQVRGRRQLRHQTAASGNDMLRGPRSPGPCDAKRIASLAARAATALEVGLLGVIGAEFVAEE
jgi:hypothetical protein